jgi:hypothetical protein
LSPFSDRWVALDFFSFTIDLGKKLNHDHPYNLTFTYSNNTPGEIRLTQAEKKNEGLYMHRDGNTIQSGIKGY